MWSMRLASSERAFCGIAGAIVPGLGFLTLILAARNSPRRRVDSLAGTGCLIGFGAVLIILGFGLLGLCFER